MSSQSETSPQTEGAVTRERGDDAPLPYRATVQVRRGAGPDKHVRLPGEEAEVVMGSHPQVAPHIGTDPEHPAHASTLDYVVGSTAACLTGTLARALAARGISLPPEDHRVKAEGHFGRRGGTLVIERIVVRHELRLAHEHRETAERVHEVYHRGCAVSRSLEGAIAISSELAFA